MSADERIERLRAVVKAAKGTTYRVPDIWVHGRYHQATMVHNGTNNDVYVGDIEHLLAERDRLQQALAAANAVCEELDWSCPDVLTDRMRPLIAAWRAAQVASEANPIRSGGEDT